MLMSNKVIVSQKTTNSHKQILMSNRMACTVVASAQPKTNRWLCL